MTDCFNCNKPCDDEFCDNCGLYIDKMNDQLRYAENCLLDGHDDKCIKIKFHVEKMFDKIKTQKAKDEILEIFRGNGL